MEAFTALRTRRSLFAFLGILLPFRIVGISPSVLMVQHICKGVELWFVTRPRNVHAVAGDKFLTRDNEMKLNAAHVRVRHPKTFKLVILQPRKGQLFKEPHHLALLFFSRSVATLKGDYA
ncbi:hypothetical protein A8B78_07995 [Jannaschia sp. EhC01]|nr:hypothetical protein A8B78_07995 [Jannaschia sp. EhC01]